MSEPPIPDGDDVSVPGSYRAGRDRVSGVGALGAIAFLGAAVWSFLRYRPSRVAVRGPSMMPTLLPGDWALVVSPPTFIAGDVVVVEHPGRPGYEMVKRLTGVPGDAVGDRVLGADEWWVVGDRFDASTDSRHFGPVTRDEIKAKVVLVYWPAGRRRRVR
jgi:nickel-type superoxide dismutase maturation protease